MSALHQSEVLVVGAGAAGLAAAVALSGAGVGVELLERKAYVGGRAYSYPHPALEEVIDSQHVLLGCCTNLLDLCWLSGADRHIRWYDRIPFLEPGVNDKAARRSSIGPSALGPLGLPAPGHSALRFLSAPMLSFRDKSRIAAGLMKFLRGYPASDAEAFSAWLRRTRQTPQAVRHFWEPIIVSTLNDSLNRCSTRYAAQVVYESLLKSAQGGRLGVPTQPMSEFYASVLELAERQGTRLHGRAGVQRIEREADGFWCATTSGGARHRARQLLLALPFEQTAALLKTLPDWSSVRGLMSDLEQFASAPITTIHLWFDRDVTQMDQAALLDTRIQWMFNKTRIRRDEVAVANQGSTNQTGASPSRASQGGASGGAHYLELVISASFAELAQEREAILASALEELARFFPAVRSAKLLKSGVLKEARATFSVTPGLDRFRPQAAAALDGLFLAGDWTRTGWPSTMEGAVRSGRLAAEAMLRAGGDRRPLLSPDLPAGWLMRRLRQR